MAEVIIFRYLNEEDANKVKSLLKGRGISSLIQTMNGEGRNSYQLAIAENDLERAKVVIENYTVELKKKEIINKQACPKCESRPPITHVAKNLSFFKRIISIGTTVMVCKKCRTEWYV